VGKESPTAPVALKQLTLERCLGTSPAPVSLRVFIEAAKEPASRGSPRFGIAPH